MGKLTVADYMKRNPALKKIAEMLENAFNEVGERIRGDLKRAYEKHATDRFSEFLVEVPKKSGPIQRDRFNRWDFDDYGKWTKYTDGSHSYFRAWEDIQKVLHNFKLDLTHAREKANEAYEHARDSFVYKNLGKISEVLGKRSDLKNAVIRFDWRGNYFKGNLQVYLEGAYFRGDVDIKYVVRTIPNVTPYFQYPLIFIEAEIGGKHYTRPSEMELRNMLSGKSSEQHEKEKVAQAAAEGWCPVSGTQVPEKLYRGVAGMMSPYVKCHICGSGVSAQRGVYRKHKTIEAEKKVAAAKLTDAGYCPMSNQAAPYHLIEKFIKSYTVYPSGQPKTEYSFDTYAPGGKSRTILCESCGQNVVIGDARGAYEPQKVRAFYRKHKLKK